MIKNLIYIFVLLLFIKINYLSAQSEASPINGKVTYITSQNIYVKFPSTEKINVGDTLYRAINEISTACLIVRKKSSTSCVCALLEGCEIKKEDAVFFTSKITDPIPKQEEDKKTEVPVSANEGIEDDTKDQVSDAKEVKKAKTRKERIRGRLSAASYSSIVNEQDPRHRLMYRFSMNALNLRDTKLSAETYVNFRQNIKPGELTTNTLRVYNLAMKYDIDSTFSLTLGRKINNKASSLGAIDGLQSEKYFGNFYVGAIVGFRPDLIEFDFNPNLLEFGGYGGFMSRTKKLYSLTTLGLLEQRNSGNIDRRYTYFQHSSTIGRKLNLFASFELDLYNKINNESSMDLRLTNLYVSARYQFSRKVNVTLSYDSRKRIIFYETLKTDIERLLDDDEARQGLRFRFNIKPHKYITTGLALSRRFQANNQNKSDNLNGFVSISKLPIGGRMSINYNQNSSIYLKSNIISVRHSRSILKNKLNLDFYFRNVAYEYLTSELKVQQNYYGAGFVYRLNRKWMFNMLGEISTRSGTENFRINSKIINRFGK